MFKVIQDQFYLGKCLAIAYFGYCKCDSDHSVSFEHCICSSQIVEYVYPVKVAFFIVSDPSFFFGLEMGVTHAWWLMKLDQTNQPTWLKCGAVYYESRDRVYVCRAPFVANTSDISWSTVHSVCDQTYACHVTSETSSRNQRINWMGLAYPLWVEWQQSQHKLSRVTINAKTLVCTEPEEWSFGTRADLQDIVEVGLKQDLDVLCETHWLCVYEHPSYVCYAIDRCPGYIDQRHVYDWTRVWPCDQIDFRVMYQRNPL
jgi:hypothetical protein